MHRISWTYALHVLVGPGGCSFILGDVPVCLPGSLRLVWRASQQNEDGLPDAEALAQLRARASTLMMDGGQAKNMRWSKAYEPNAETLTAMSSSLQETFKGNLNLDKFVREASARRR